jgi:hypothetical protein
MAFCGILYKLGELDGETERIVASLNHFSPKRTRRCSTSKIPRLRTPRVESDMCFWAGTRVLSGMRGWITHSRREALESAIFTPPPRKYPALTHSPSRLAYFWCVATQAEWDAAVGSLALRFSPNGPSKTRCHDDTTKTPCFDTLAVESGACLMLGQPR